MKRDKLRYKLSIKSKERLNATSFSDSLNDALSMKDMDSFWRTWHSKFSKSQLPSVIDGCCNETDIAHRFTEVFKAVCIPNSKDKNEHLHATFEKRFVNYKCESTSAGFVTVHLVQKCIEGLKKGKAAGLDGLMAEHIYFAHPIVWVHLALLF